MMAVAALASCSQDEQVNISTGENEIVAGATTLSVDATTKAPVNSIPAGGLLARVPVSETSGNYSDEWQTNAGYMKFTAESTETSFCDQTGTNVTPKFYPSDGNKNIYLCGLYPAATWSITTGTATFNLTGKDDIMAAKQASTTKASSSTLPTLAFEHKLTLLRIKFKAEQQTDADAWGGIETLELLNKDGKALGTQVSINLVSGDASFDTGTGSLEFYKYDGSAYSETDKYTNTKPTVNDDGVYVAYILCPPVVATADPESAEYQLKITAEGGASDTVNINLKDTGNTTDFDENTVGSAFDILLNFKATEIKAQATITAWKEGGTTEVPVGE